MNEMFTPLLLEASIKKLNSLKEYDKFLKQFPLVSPNKIKIGYFYAMDYDFSLDYPEDVVKYFDERPLDLIFNTKGSQYIYGLNFHFVPVLNRSWLLGRLKNLNPKVFEKKGFSKININYLTLKSVYAKSQYCVRMYRRDRVREARQIPNDKIMELVKFAPPTYYKVNINQVMDRHKNYPSPTQKKKTNLKESLEFDFEAFNIFANYSPILNQSNNLILNDEEINPFQNF